MNDDRVHDDRAYYSSLGLLVSLRCADDRMRSRVDELYSACRVETRRRADLELAVDLDATTLVYELRADGVPYARGTDRDELLEWVAWKINSAAVERERSHLVLHAAAVARDGDAVIVTGSSGAGKSTLAAALTLCGAAYMGDDSLVVDADAQLHSNPKPIAVDDESRAALLRLAPATAALRAGGGLVAPGALGEVMVADAVATPVVIVHSVYRPDAPTTVVPLSPAGAAELLADQSFNFSPLGAAGLHAVAAVARRARAVVVEFGDVGGAVEAISGVLAAAIAAGPPDADAVVAPAARSGLAVELLSGEALIWDRRVRELHHLSATATAIWLACDESAGADAVAARLAPGTIEPPDDFHEVVARCIDDLAGLGLLARNQDSTPR